MKTKIKDFMFIADSFGPLPIWTLQDLKKGVDDAYVLISPEPDKPIRNKKEAKVRNLFRRIDDTFPCAEVFITGEVEWEKGKEDWRCITDLKIENIAIYPSDSGQI